MRSYRFFFFSHSVNSPGKKRTIEKQIVSTFVLRDMPALDCVCIRRERVTSGFIRVLKSRSARSVSTYRLMGYRIYRVSFFPSFFPSSSSSSLHAREERLYVYLGILLSQFPKSFERLSRGSSFLRRLFVDPSFLFSSVPCYTGLSFRNFPCTFEFQFGLESLNES